MIFKILLIFASLGISVLVGFSAISIANTWIYQRPRVEGHKFSKENLPSKIVPQPVVLGKRIITAYTASPEETDNTPCEGALAGINFCETKLAIVATNELPFGTRIEIDGKEYLVADRMNRRYQYRYDILMSSKVEALQFGKQIKEVKIIK